MSKEVEYLKSTIELKEMEFWAYHGHFTQEQIIGNRFVVSVAVEYDISKAGRSDLLEDALNYQELYSVVEREMAHTSHLLESVASRIVDALFNTFPQIEGVSLELSKINPPLGGKLHSSKVTLKKRGYDPNSK
ncbi:MAG: dihydroneopterin aldolase [Bacteroidales bacterium]